VPLKHTAQSAEWASTPFLRWINFEGSHLGYWTYQATKMSSEKRRTHSGHIPEIRHQARKNDSKY
jgi:hypothetical protein